MWSWLDTPDDEGQKVGVSRTVSCINIRFLVLGVSRARCVSC